MPLYFWNDADGARYRASYFETYPDNFDGSGRGAVWRHGDWLKVDPDGSCIIYGRSDATINRHGLRMGTSELYSAIEALPEVMDSLVVDLEYLGRDSYMPLFVVLREGVRLDASMKDRINKAIEAGLSRRFLPNDIFAVAEIPRTLSGKKQELPIKKLLLGHPVEKVINREAMANPGLPRLVSYVCARLSRPRAGFVTPASRFNQPHRRKLRGCRLHSVHRSRVDQEQSPVRAAMADLNTVLTKLNDRLLRLEGELFVLRSLARATLTAGDDHATRMRKLVEAAKVALDDEARRPLDKPTRKYVDAATALVEELLEEPTVARPLFTVIDGGRRD